MRVLSCFLVLVMFLLGCSSSTSENADRAVAKYADSSMIASGDMLTGGMSPVTPEAMMGMGGIGMGGMGMGMGEGDKERDGNDVAAIENRKIIYTAELSIVVEDFSEVEASVASLVKKFGGFVADSNVDSKDRKRRRGEWKVRIPVKTFDAFLDQTGMLGVTVSRSQQAQDVTDEYVDVEARIANKKKLEARILELLERPDDKIQHVIEVEKELGRVREEIERMEGRMRYLDDKIQLTTVSLSIREEKEYRPPSRPGVSGRISKAWNSSLSRTQQFFEDTIVWLVGNALPIAFWSIIGVAAYVLIRKRLKSRLAAAASNES